MSELQTITERQAEIGATIDKVLTNFKKDSKDRKTKVYLTSKLKDLEDLWEEFEKNDDEIRESCSEPTTNDYLTKDFYKQVQNVYMSLKDKIQKLLREQVGQSSNTEKPFQATISNASTRVKQLGGSLQRAMITLDAIVENAQTAPWQTESVLDHVIARIEKFQMILEQKEKEILKYVGEENLPYSQQKFQELQIIAEEALL